MGFHEQAYPVMTFGGALPAHAVDNAELIAETGIDSSADWIVDRTGIETRHFAEPDSGNDSQLIALAAAAGKHVLRVAEVSPEHVTSLDLATTTPPRASPNVAVTLHRMLALPEAASALDIRAHCAGLLAGLEIACGRLHMREDNSTAIVIGANLLSRMVDPSDRRTVVLFGDGAGAAVMTRQPGALRPRFRSISQPDEAAIYAQHDGVIQMDGGRVARHAVDIMTRSAIAVAQDAGLYHRDKGIDWGQIDYVIPHQANLRLIETVADNLGVPTDQCITTVDRHGNTSSASIPLAVAHAQSTGRIPPGRHTALITTVGAGFVGGAAIFQFEVPNHPNELLELPRVG